MRDRDLSEVLLDWYDLNARDMPWRVGPAARAAGVVPDPYRVWLSEIMLQQTTVAAVRAYFLRFTDLWPTVHDLAAADDAAVMAEWAGLGYYARARNLLACSRVVAGELVGQFPSETDDLQKLPGVGPYTAAAIAAIAFDRPAVVVDGNVERVMARMFRIETPLPDAKPLIRVVAARLTPDSRPGDYAQAVMDLGATICTPKNPVCGICPWLDTCLARKDGLQASLPARVRKVAKPTRFGTAYAARRSDGAWLLERRPDRGLLGGMLGWPGTEWGSEPVAVPPFAAKWQDVGAEVRHTFTHFHLRLSVKVADAPKDQRVECGSFLPETEFRATDLPTVMRKVYALALSHFEGR